ncbi:Oidioi.mRNA.OKI2018_I69.PAR.g13232.t1.cds [Oikopleura dioica]|uniref:Oidioi.mRNA.OKI2018_I69.PAR.g13232.t1.cds n=1 Tax=Oikopleura dioica TaxID=34765 RepID=A0ABN7S8G5_OIKDI|nr:Oidioi.mRNA.OKI2018_I69.PAR.g13232.t1.cds [Oikopleura dioica]
MIAQLLKEAETAFKKIIDLQQDMGYKITYSIFSPKAKQTRFIQKSFSKDFPNGKAVEKHSQETCYDEDHSPPKKQKTSTAPAKVPTSTPTPATSTIQLNQDHYDLELVPGLSPQTPPDSMVRLAKSALQSQPQATQNEAIDQLDRPLIPRGTVVVGHENLLDDEEFAGLLDLIMESFNFRFPIHITKSVRDKVKLINVDRIEELPVIRSPRTWKQFASSDLGYIYLQILCTNLSQYFVLGPVTFEKKFNAAILGLFIERYTLLVDAMNNGYKAFSLDKNQEKQWIRKNPFAISNFIRPKEPIPDDKPLTDEEKQQVQLVVDKMREQAPTHYAQSNNLRKALAELGMPGWSNYSRVFRLLAKDGYSFERFGKAKPELSKEAKQKRLAFCKWLLEEVERTPDFLQQLLHTDECSISMREEKFGRNLGWWVKDNEAPPQHLLSFSKKFNAKIMIACCIGHNIKLSLRVFVEEQANGKLKSIKENSLGYQKICLEPWYEDLAAHGHIHIREDGTSELVGRVYVQDGARSHTSASSLEFLDAHFSLDRCITGVACGEIQGQAHREKRMHEWPPHSPDLNPLDFSLWAHLKSKVREELGRNKKLYFDSLEHAREVINLVWSQIDQSKINNMCQKLLDKAKQVVHLEGGTTEGYKANRGSLSVRDPQA